MSKVFRESSYKLGASYMLFVINLVQNNDTLYSVKLFCENQNLKMHHLLCTYMVGVVFIRIENIFNKQLQRYSISFIY